MGGGSTGGQTHVSCSGWTQQGPMGRSPATRLAKGPLLRPGSRAGPWWTSWQGKRVLNELMKPRKDNCYVQCHQLKDMTFEAPKQIYAVRWVELFFCILVCSFMYLLYYTVLSHCLVLLLRCKTYVKLLQVKERHFLISRSITMGFK